MRVSVVVPVADEAASLARVIEEIYSVTPSAVLGEVIVVDDASTDETPVVMRRLISNPGLQGLRYLRHERRGGQSIAIHTGAAAARFQVIVTFDGDGQNDPADIGRLATRVAATDQPGAALVCGVRTRRRAARSRVMMSTFGQWLRRMLLRDGSRDAGCGIKSFQRKAYLRMPLFPRQHLYLAVLFKSAGYEVAEIAVNDRPGVAGSSKRSSVREAAAMIPDIAGVLWLTRNKSMVLTEIWPDGGVERHPAQIDDELA